MQSETWQQPHRWEGIQKGISQDQVREILGDARKVDVDRNVLEGHEIAVWFYGPGWIGGQVQFYDGRVMGWVVPNWEELAKPGSVQFAMSQPKDRTLPVRDPPYLQGPVIQLGFYWHDLPDTEAYARLFRWLLAQGYHMHSTVVAMRSRDGRLPRYDQLATHGLPSEDVRQLREWTADKLISEREWLPVKVRLLPIARENVEIDLGYALMFEESLRAGDHRVVEIVASDADMSVVINSRMGNIAAEIVQSALRTDLWYRETFRRVCDELDPDYGGLYWEWDLQPPASLVASQDMSGFSGIYISERLARAEAVRSFFGQLGSWVVKRSWNGVLLCLRGRSDRAGFEQGRDFIAGAIRTKFLPGSSG